MNTNRFPCLRSWLATGLALAMSPVLHSTQPSEQSSTAPADLVLFVGMDLLVSKDGSAARVEDYKRNSILIGTPAGMTTVRSSSIDSIHIEREPRITAARVEIADLSTERRFSPGNDPEMIALQQHSALVNYQAELQSQADTAIREMESAETLAARLPENERKAVLENARQKLDSAQQMVRNTAMDPLELQNKVREQGADAFDTFQVTCMISSPVELRGSYVLLLTTIREPGSTAKLANRFTLSELPVLTPEPRKIVLMQESLPTGFTVHSFELHFYDAGRELASNLSPGRTAISRSDAHTFLVLQRELKHRDADLAAEVATALLPPENRTRIPPAHASRTARVGINSDGRVTDVGLDTAGSPEADAAIEAAIRACLFLPTLRAGRPVASTLTFNLSEFIP